MFALHEKSGATSMEYLLHKRHIGIITILYTFIILFSSESVIGIFTYSFFKQGKSNQYFYAYFNSAVKGHSVFMTFEHVRTFC